MTEPIFKTPEEAYHYAYDNKCRLSLEGGQLITQDSFCSYLYANEILKGRFKLGERSIAKNYWHSYLYAVNVLKGRFKLCEELISRDNYYCCLYVHDVFKGLIPLDFLELCSIEILESLLDNVNYFRNAVGLDLDELARFFDVNRIINKNDIIKVLFKKRFLE